MASNWKDALLDQADADFSAFRIVSSTPGIKLCHRIHFLQMGIEKLLKGLMSDGLEPPETKHRVAEKFFKDVRAMPHVSAALGFSSHRDFMDFMRKLQDFFLAIEEMVPTAGQRENAEYPWEQRSLDDAGQLHMQVMVPADYPYDLLDRHGYLSLMNFVEGCMAAYKAGKL